MDIKNSIHSKCLHNENGICYYLASDPYPCETICINFVSFNKKLMRRIGVDDKVDWYSFEKWRKKKTR